MRLLFPHLLRLGSRLFVKREVTYFYGMPLTQHGLLRCHAIRATYRARTWPAFFGRQSCQSTSFLNYYEASNPPHGRGEQGLRPLRVVKQTETVRRFSHGVSNAYPFCLDDTINFSQYVFSFPVSPSLPQIFSCATLFSTYRSAAPEAQSI